MPKLRKGLQLFYNQQSMQKLDRRIVIIALIRQMVPHKMSIKCEPVKCEKIERIRG